MSDPSTPHRPFRIADVAALAGVSTATVSRALTDPAKLRPATLARVTEAVRATGFTPNLAARSLRARRTRVVLVVVPDIANPFFSDVLRGIDEALTPRGYGWLLGNMGQARHPDARIVDIVLAGQVDGVLLLNGSVPTAQGRSLLSAGVPVVAVCERIENAPIPQVEAQNEEAAAQAAAHLLALGHRRLAYLSGPAGNVLEQARHAGFLAGVRAGGQDPAAVQCYTGDFTLAAGVEAARCFLASAQRPTGLFAANDEMAIGFLKTVRAAGVAVPGALSVIGFDGIEFADFVEPTLTTFHQPRRALGRQGAELLLRAMAGEAIPPTQARLRLPVTLLERDSTGPAPQDAPP